MLLRRQVGLAGSRSHWLLPRSEQKGGFGGASAHRMVELAEPGGRVLGLRLRCGGADEGGGVLRLADGGLQKRVPALRNAHQRSRCLLTSRKGLSSSAPSTGCVCTEARRSRFLPAPPPPHRPAHLLARRQRLGDASLPFPCGDHVCLFTRKSVDAF